MGRLTTHVLDTALGRPAAGLTIELYRLGGGDERLVAATTNADGRVDRPLLEGARFRSRRLRAAVPRRRLPAQRRERCPIRRSSTSSRSASASPRRTSTTTCRCSSRPTATRPIAEAEPSMRQTIRFIRKGRLVELDRRRADDAAARLSARGRRARRAPRKAAARATAAPARWRSAGCATGGSSTSRSTPASSSSARSTAARWSRSRISPTPTARSIRSRRRWSRSTPRNAASARRASS